MDIASFVDIKLALCDEEGCTEMSVVRLSEGAVQYKPQKPMFGSEGAVKCDKEGSSVQAWADSNLAWLN